MNLITKTSICLVVGKLLANAAVAQANYAPFTFATLADSAGGYLRRFFADFLAEYRTVVKTNFPTITGGFALFSELPVRIHLVVRPRMRNFAHEVNCGLTEIVEKLPAGSENEVVICDQSEVVFDADPISHVVTVKGRRIEPIGQVTRDSVTEFLCRNYQSTPLHDLVYGRIAEEWSQAMATLRTVEGLPPRIGKHATPTIR